MGKKPDKSKAKNCIRNFDKFCKKFRYEPFDRQKEFHESDAIYRLFGDGEREGRAVSGHAEQRTAPCHASCCFGYPWIGPDHVVAAVGRVVTTHYGASLYQIRE